MLTLKVNKVACYGALLALCLMAPALALGGDFKSFRIPTANSLPRHITLGPDGNMWFTESASNVIGRVDPRGNITEFVVPTSSQPDDIVSGPDGALWFTETVGPDGALWFAEQNGNQIGRIATSGNITEFGPASGPERITMGPDGNLWFTELFNNAIGRIDPTTGVITEFPLPTSNAQPQDIVAGPDGNLWFTEYKAGQLAQITPTGVITEVQKVRGGPWGIAVGAPGTNTIWITLFDGNRVAQFTVGP